MNKRPEQRLVAVTAPHGPVGPTEADTYTMPDGSRWTEYAMDDGTIYVCRTDGVTRQWYRIDS